MGMLRWKVVLCALLANAPSPEAIAQLSVSSNGQATYSLAIAVPPGIAGMEPKLALAYVDGGINGPQGHGWSVQGISSITRCPASRATDGAVRGVVFGPNDKLCLDGQRLIQTDAAGVPLALASQTADAAGLAGGAVREYRTEKDTFVRVRAYGTANGSDASNGPATFKVWTKSGHVYEYGTNPNGNANALINAQGKTAVAVWAVSRIGDVVGNVIDFKYEQRDIAWGSGPTAGSPLVGHEWNVAEIQYSGNKIIFTYIDRGATVPADAAETYQVGSKNVSIRRLQSITTYTNSANVTALGPAAGAVAVKTYRLDYGNGPITKRSRLSAVTECAGSSASTKCMPATIFGYAQGGTATDSFASNAAFKASPLATTTMQSTTGGYGVIVGDFNGDGRADFIRWSNTPAQNRLYLSNGDGTFAQVPVGTGAGQFNATDINLFQRPSQGARSDGCFMSIVADFNADGLSDVLRWASSSTTGAGGASCPAGQQNLLLLSNGDGSFQRIVPTEEGTAAVLPLSRVDAYANPGCAGGFVPCYNYGRNFFVGDYNGDGILDLVEVAVTQAIYANGVDWSCMTGPTSCYTQVRWGRGDGKFSAPVYSGPPAFSNPGRFDVFALDADGDGMSDLIVRPPGGGPGGVALISLGNGQFNRVPGLPACWSSGTYQIADLNGDGRFDFVCAQQSVSNNAIHLSNGGLSFFANAPSTTPGRLSLNGTGQDLVSSTAIPGAGFTTGDFNADGRTDILRFADDASFNKLYLSNGDGTFTESQSLNFDNGAAQLSKTDGTADFVIGDFTGRGSVEILRLMNGAATATTDAGKNQLYTKIDTPPPDLLQTVTSPTGLVTRLTRTPLPNAGTRYASDRGDASNKAAYPKVDLTPTMQVVTTVEADSGVGLATTKTEYAYRGFKATYSGRGMLGFREIRQQSQAPNGQAQTVLTHHLQDHPYIGVASMTQGYLGDLTLSSATLLNQTTYSYCDKTSGSGPTDIKLVGGAPAPCSTTALVQRPYLYQSLEKGWDLNGAVLPVLRTTNSFNNTGDPLTVNVVTSGTALGLGQTSTKLNTNTYFADNTAGDNWILGRLQRATVQSTVPNSLASIATAAGSSPYSTARQGTGIQPPLSPAVMSAILQLLLDD